MYLNGFSHFFGCTLGYDRLSYFLFNLNHSFARIEQNVDKDEYMLLLHNNLTEWIIYQLNSDDSVYDPEQLYEFLKKCEVRRKKLLSRLGKNSKKWIRLWDKVEARGDYDRLLKVRSRKANRTEGAEKAKWRLQTRKIPGDNDEVVPAYTES